MNVLYLAHRIPYPPDKGDKIRSFHQVRYLGARHRVFLVCFADDRRDMARAEVLRASCASVDVIYRSPRMARLAGLRGLLDGRALSVAAFDSHLLRRAVASRLPEADVAIAFSSVMAQYLPGGSHVPRVMDFVDVDSEKWRLYAERHPWPASWIFAREAERLGQFEEAIARDWDHSLFVSEREARVLRKRVPGVPMTVLPTGIDLDAFGTPSPDGFGDPSSSTSLEPRIVFTGVMDYFPNVDAVRYFCGEIFPLIRKQAPNARFTIVGRNPTRSVRALGRIPGVEVTGAVPDVRPYLASAWISVAPLRVARGLQHKILEAMAMGLPIVGTTAAFEGLDTREGTGMDAVDDPHGFAERIIALLRDETQRRNAGRRSRTYIERHFQWMDHGAALEALLLRLARASSSGP